MDSIDNLLHVRSHVSETIYFALQFKSFILGFSKMASLCKTYPDVANRANKFYTDNFPHCQGQAPLEVYTRQTGDVRKRGWHHRC